MKGSHLILYSFTILMVGIVGGYALNEYSSALLNTVRHADLRMADRHGIRLTNPLLECAEQPERYYKQNLTDLEDRVEKMANDAQKDSSLTYASVYYRDLNNGPWFGVNESEEFIPASLLKLPLVMTFYWKAEDDPGLFGREVAYSPDVNSSVQEQPFGPQKNIVAGQKYTVKDLIKYTLQESSNEAAIALSNIAGQDQIFSVYKDLGLKSPVMNQDYHIDTRTYASFFRILYNATYIDRPASEEILSMLSDASFKDGLIAGVPTGTVVAHKFGSRKTDSGKDQLHDCGIIYAPGKPYILCVMTHGNDFTKLADFIKNISSVVYAEVTRTSN